MSHAIGCDDRMETVPVPSTTAGVYTSSCGNFATTGGGDVLATPRENYVPQQSVVLPNAPAAAANNSGGPDGVMFVRVPPGVVTGETVQFNRNGQWFLAEVPALIAPGPGALFPVQIPKHLQQQQQQLQPSALQWPLSTGAAAVRLGSGTTNSAAAASGARAVEVTPRRRPRKSKATVLPKIGDTIWVRWPDDEDSRWYKCRVVANVDGTAPLNVEAAPGAVPALQDTYAFWPDPKDWDREVRNEWRWDDPTGVAPRGRKRRRGEEEEEGDALWVPTAHHDWPIDETYMTEGAADFLAESCHLTDEQKRSVLLSEYRARKKRVTWLREEMRSAHGVQYASESASGGTKKKRIPAKDLLEMWIALEVQQRVEWPKEAPQKKRKKKQKAPKWHVGPPPTIEEFFDFMIERESIRIRRQRSPADPLKWTEDPIFRSYKFTNVRRENDRTTRGFRRITDARREVWLRQQGFRVVKARVVSPPKRVRAMKEQTPARREKRKRKRTERFVAETSMNYNKRCAERLKETQEEGGGGAAASASTTAAVPGNGMGCVNLWCGTHTFFDDEGREIDRHAYIDPHIKNTGKGCLHLWRGTHTYFNNHTTTKDALSIRGDKTKRRTTGAAASTASEMPKAKKKKKKKSTTRCSASPSSKARTAECSAQLTSREMRALHRNRMKQQQQESVTGAASCGLGEGDRRTGQQAVSCKRSESLGKAADRKATEWTIRDESLLMVFNCCLQRQFGTVVAAETIGYVTEWGPSVIDRIVGQCMELWASKVHVFTGAYQPQSIYRNAEKKVGWFVCSIVLSFV